MENAQNKINNHLNVKDQNTMETNNEPKRPENVHIAYTEVINPEGTRDQDFIVTRIGTVKKCVTKYEVVCLVANVEKCKDMTVEEFFNQDVFASRNFTGQDFVNAGFRKITTSPQFDTTVDRSGEPTETDDPTTPNKPFKDYPLVADGHLKMQQLMDGYSLGRKPSETALERAKTKAKAQELDSIGQLLADQGVDVNDFASVKEAIASMVAKKKRK